MEKQPSNTTQEVTRAICAMLPIVTAEDIARHILRQIGPAAEKWRNEEITRFLRMAERKSN